MSTILFDLRATQPFALGHHGAAMYAIAVFRQFASTTRGRHAIGFYDADRPLANDVAQMAASGNVELKALDSMQGVQALIDQHDGGRFYSALPYGYSGLNLDRLDVVLTIHGLRPLELPDDRYEYKYAAGLKGLAVTFARRILRSPLRRRKRQQFGRLLDQRNGRRRIVVPSQHTKYAILVEFPEFSADDIIVCYSPITDVCARTDTSPEFVANLGLDDRGYILLVSTDRWGKNSYRALAAIDELLARRPELADLRVVAVGGPPARAPAAWRKRHLYMSNLDSHELASLYRHARLLLYPSLNEGFGYPPLESMSYGTPVIASASTAIPEISGDGAVYVSAHSIGDMQTRLLWLLSDQRAWDEYAERAKRRYQEVSAEQTRMLDQLCQLLLDDHEQQ